MRVGLLVLSILLFSPVRSSAEWQIRPFLGVTFGGSTTFVLTKGAASPNLALGVSGRLLGDVIGIDVDFAHAPGFFQSGDQELVLGSSVTTLTGNVVLTPPRRLTEYVLGPYLVVGAGVMRARIDDFLSALSVTSTLPAMDVGGGVNGFLSDRIGLSWEARYFRSVGGKVAGVSVDPEEASERLSFWRASMALVIRR